MPLLSLDRVTKKFGGLVAVRDFSFELQGGEILGIIGPNGAGKSTAFNMIAGIYKPDGGTIRLSGERIDGLKPYQVCRRGIGRTFQLVKPFLNETVFENILMASSFGNPASSGSREEAERALSSVGLEKFRDDYVGTLPFLLRRKVELARAVATGGKLLLLDEPMAGLNPVEIMEFVGIIKKIRDGGATILLIEHVIRAVMELSSRVIVLDHGEKISEGLPADVARDQRVIQAYLGE